MYSYNKADTLYNPANQLYTPEATWFSPTTSNVAKAKWTGILSENAFLEADISNNRVEAGLLPQEGAGDSYYAI